MDEPDSFIGLGCENCLAGNGRKKKKQNKNSKEANNENFLKTSYGGGVKNKPKSSLKSKNKKPKRKNPWTTFSASYHKTHDWNPTLCSIAYKKSKLKGKKKPTKKNN